MVDRILLKIIVKSVLFRLWNAFYKMYKTRTPAYVQFWKIYLDCKVTLCNCLTFLYLLELRILYNFVRVKRFQYCQSFYTLDEQFLILKAKGEVDNQQ